MNEALTLLVWGKDLQKCEGEQQKEGREERKRRGTDSEVAGGS